MAYIQTALLLSLHAFSDGILANVYIRYRKCGFVLQFSAPESLVLVVVTRFARIGPLRSVRMPIGLPTASETRKIMILTAISEKRLMCFIHLHY